MTTPKYTEEQVVALLEQQAKAQAEAAGKTPPEDPPKDPPSGPVTNLDASTIAAARKIVEAADAIKSDPPADKTPPADQPPAFNAEAEFAKLSEQVKALTARPPASNGGAPTTPPAYDPSRAEPFLPGMTEAQKAEAVSKWIEVNGQKSMVDLGLAVMAGGG